MLTVFCSWVLNIESPNNHLDYVCHRLRKVSWFSLALVDAALCNSFPSSLDFWKVNFWASYWNAGGGLHIASPADMRHCCWSCSHHCCCIFFFSFPCQIMLLSSCFVKNMEALKSCHWKKLLLTFCRYLSLSVQECWLQESQAGNWNVESKLAFGSWRKMLVSGMWKSWNKSLTLFSVFCSSYLRVFVGWKLQ